MLRNGSAQGRHCSIREGWTRVYQMCYVSEKLQRESLKLAGLGGGRLFRFHIYPTCMGLSTSMGVYHMYAIPHIYGSTPTT